MRFYKTGEFAELIDVSAVTLREWDKRGWLVPHHKSPSGYRYYSEAQLKEYYEKGLVRRDNEKGLC